MPHTNNSFPFNIASPVHIRVQKIPTLLFNALLLLLPKFQSGH